ncbi:MerR family transcriptional regulator [Streptomyces griseocarneus]|uniref:MerR family transcriptional regulator n=1 Tax=Streptomyces griseocarneus TaxID=51201 RepID=UPI00167DF57C|nr:MerR family transcriptional regulator [Streptomyces griseocarneus]MBZ6473931.1 MerR family transcriptional regulator [Streptomyces griseocarneus]GHG65967.1 MerR family transcriptional regulator [Streptomyces griseocarneus]
MRIGELSRRTGVSPRLLRYYEQQDLLGSERDTNGYRRYHPDAPERVARIRELLDAGMTTEVIRTLLPCAQGGPGLLACSHSVQVLDDQLARVDEQMAELRRKKEALLGVTDAMETRRHEDEALARAALKSA